MLISSQWICGARNLGHTTQEMCTQENKELFKNIFTSLLSQIIINPPTMNTCGLRQNSGPTENFSKGKTYLQSGKLN